MQTTPALNRGLQVMPRCMVARIFLAFGVIQKRQNKLFVRFTRDVSAGKMESRIDGPHLVNLQAIPHVTKLGSTAPPFFGYVFNM